MKLLLDANLSPRIVPSLVEAGYDVTHISDLDRGAIVSLSPTRLAVRQLPIR